MPSTIAAAEIYTPCNDLWAITAYFNPCHYRTRRANYHRFADSMEQSGLHLLTMECAFGDDPFELKPSPLVVQVRSRDVLWQKERLLNMGVKRLPPAVRKVAWIDGDVLFANPHWAVEASKLFEDVPIVQLFEQAIRLERDDQAYHGTGRVYDGWAAVRAHQVSTQGQAVRHGHPGFAWAAQRALLETHGLYDVAFDIEADHLMAHAFYGEHAGVCMQKAMTVNLLAPVMAQPGEMPTQPARRALWSSIRRWLGRRLGLCRTNYAWQAHYDDWACPLHQNIQGRVAYVPGTLLHLWHGDLERRSAPPIRRALHRLRFNPTTDVRIAASECWERSGTNPSLGTLAVNMFRNRREDGDPDLSQ